MSKQTIKDAIAQNITGQGNQIDQSGQLGNILNAMVDEIPAPAPAQEQADWNESDNNSPAYIKNKPDLSVPILEVMNFDIGDVDTLEQLYPYIKLNGQNITSLQELTALQNKFFLVTRRGYNDGLRAVQFSATSNQIYLQAGVITSSFGGAGLEVYMNLYLDSISYSSILFNEI